MSYATVIMYNVEEDPSGEDRMDYYGLDCEDTEEALGFLREGLAKLRARGLSFIFAGMQSGVTVEQLMEMSRQELSERQDQG
jgi:hypothetical protein